MVVACGFLASCQTLLIKYILIATYLHLMLQLSSMRADGIWACFGKTRYLHSSLFLPAGLFSVLKLRAQFLVTKKPQPLFFLCFSRFLNFV